MLSKSGEVVFQHGGRYELDGHKRKAQADLRVKGTKGMIGRIGMYTIKVEDDTMTQADAGGVFNESWQPGLNSACGPISAKSSDA